VVKPLAEMDVLPAFAMALGLQSVILTGLFWLDEAGCRTRQLAIVAVLIAAILPARLVSLEIAHRE